MNQLIEVTNQLDIFIDTRFGNLEMLYTSPEGLDKEVAEITRIAKSAIIDYTTKEGAIQLKLLGKNISKCKKILDDEGKKLCDILKERPKLIDATRRKMRQQLEALEEEILLPLTEIENRKNEINKIKNIHLEVHQSDSQTIRTAIEDLQCIVIDAEYWKESLEDAKKAIKGEIKVLETILANAEKREAEAAELEKLRQEQEEAQRIIREEQIRKAAEEKAAAEKAKFEEENKRLKAEIEKAKSQPPKQTENVEVKKDKSEALKKAAAELKEALLPLVGGDAEMARNIGIAIYRGQLPHVTFTP